MSEGLLTKDEFAAQEVSHNKGNALDGTLTGIVTYIKTEEGYFYVLSCYEEDNWTFPPSKVYAGMENNQRTLNFTKIRKIEQQRMAKWIILQFMKEGKSLGTLYNCLKNLSLYFQWVNNQGISNLNAVTAREYVKYINTLICNCGKRKGGPLGKSTKVHRFIVLEELHRRCNHFDFVEEHPWLESSSNEQAGLVGLALADHQNTSQTKIIPDEILKPLCGVTKTYLIRADELLNYKKRLDEIVFSGNSVTQWEKKNKFLHSLGYQDTVGKLNKELRILRDCCLFWILLTTGMRIHEVLGIKSGGYRSENIDGVSFYYIKSVSTKTYEGEAEWIAPEIAINAIEILERLSSSIQKKLLEQLDRAKDQNNFEEVEHLNEISGSIGLCIQYSKINIICNKAIRHGRFPILCKLANVNWNLTPHQFRRTFANHAVHSELGDLRALKDHFKHWSLSMTALYAANPDLDRQMMEEILHDRYLIEEEISSDWFSLEMPITGGLSAQKSIEIRTNAEKVKTYPNRKAMVRAFTSSITFRSTGIGWCLNDDKTSCLGSCDNCDDGIVDYRHIKHWESMFIQQLELAETMTDIGRAGQHAVALGLQRCEKVLTDLGVNVESIKSDFKNRNRMA